MSKSQHSTFLLLLVLCTLVLMLLDFRNLRIVGQIKRPIISVVASFIRIFPSSEGKFRDVNLVDTPGIIEPLLKLQVYQDENEALRKLLNFVRHYPGKFFSTRIIGNIKEHTFTAIKDIDVQLEPEQLVVNENGIVGKITTVKDNLVIGILVTHPQFRIPVISSVTKNQFVLSGTGNKKILQVHYLEGHLLNDELILSTIGAQRIPVARVQRGTKTVEALIKPEGLDLIAVYYINVDMLH